MTLKALWDLGVIIKVIPEPQSWILSAKGNSTESFEAALVFSVNMIKLMVKICAGIQDILQCVHV